MTSAMEASWPAALQSLTEKLSVDNLPHQVRSCRTLEEKIEKVLTGHEEAAVEDSNKEETANIPDSLVKFH